MQHFGISEVNKRPALAQPSALHCAAPAAKSTFWGRDEAGRIPGGSALAGFFAETRWSQPDVNPLLLPFVRQAWPGERCYA
jgi:hypothetical protein